MPLAIERRRIAGLRQRAGDSHRILAQALVFDREPDLVHAVSDRDLAGHRRVPGRRARGLGIHPREQHALVGHLIEPGRRIAADLLQRRNADRAERLIVPHQVNDVRRPAVFLAQRRETRVEVLVFRRPLLAVLGVKDIILGVVDDPGLLCWATTGSTSASVPLKIAPIAANNVVTRVRLAAFSPSFGPAHLITAKGYCESIMMIFFRDRGVWLATVVLVMFAISLLQGAISYTLGVRSVVRVFCRGTPRCLPRSC